MMVGEFGLCRADGLLPIHTAGRMGMPAICQVHRRPWKAIEVSAVLTPAVLVLTLAAMPAAAEGLLLDLDPGSGATSSETDGDWQTPRLTVHERQCNFPPECAIVSLSCEGSLRVSIEGIDQPALARWMTEQEELSIDLKGIAGQEGEAYAVEMLRSDLDGNWSAIFQIPYSSDPGLSIIADELSIGAPVGTTRVLLTGGNRTALQQFIEFCARE